MQREQKSCVSALVRAANILEKNSVFNEKLCKKCNSQHWPVVLLTALV